MKRIGIALFLALLVFCAAGCAEEDRPAESAPAASASEPITEEVPEDFDFDWDQVISETVESITNPEWHPEVVDATVKVDQDKKTITFVAVLADATAPEMALECADQFVRQFNSNANKYDGSVKACSNEYYGGLYDVYAIDARIAPASAAKDPNKWFVVDTLLAGSSYRKFQLNKIYQ